MNEKSYNIYIQENSNQSSVGITTKASLNMGCFQNAVANPQPSLGVVRAEEPKSLNYSGETSRLLSFRRWPQNANQTADDLARAGFYYTGRVASICFSTHQFSLLSPPLLFCLLSIFFSTLSVLPFIYVFFCSLYRPHPSPGNDSYLMDVIYNLL